MKPAYLNAVGLGRRSSGRWLVCDLHLALSPSTLYYLVGRNGAGKTTLLRLLAGLLQPTSGTVTLCGRRIWRAGPNVLSNIGFAPADGGYYPNLTIRQNLELSVSLSARPDMGRVDKVASLLGLRALMQRTAKSLSKGQKKRLAIGSAWVGNHVMLLFDEPYADLDVPGLQAVQALIFDTVRKSEAIVLVASALPPDHLSVASTVGILEAGRLLEQRAFPEGFDQAVLRTWLQLVSPLRAGGGTDEIATQT